ncbi:MAG: hypothetical protein E7449_01205 [Ruminococcaceae bacterium]|nr:hypothetical protein [Oscillospiraceae bacterium]
MCTCDRALELINEKIDQCISQENDAVLRSHLSACDECRSVYESYSLIQQDLLTLEEEPPENFAGQVMFRVMAEQQKKKSRKVPFRIIGTAACAAALALVIGFTDVGSFLVPKMKSEALMNGSTAMSDNAMLERVSDYSTSDTATGTEAPMAASDAAEADFAEPSEYADGWADDVVVDEAEQFDADKGEAVVRALSDYAVVLIYDSSDLLGDYFLELPFSYGEWGLQCEVSIALAEEIYETCPNASHYEIYQQAYAAMAEAIILIQE